MSTSDLLQRARRLVEACSTSGEVARIPTLDRRMIAAIVASTTLNEFQVAAILGVSPDRVKSLELGAPAGRHESQTLDVISRRAAERRQDGRRYFLKLTEFAVGQGPNMAVIALHTGVEL